MDKSMDKRKKVLFIHNSLPEYRIEFWKKLSALVDLKLIITSGKLAKKIYGLEGNTNGLDLVYWIFKDKKFLKKMINKYECVILPPADSLKEIVVCQYVCKLCKENKIPYIYWTEKWETKLEYQPIKKQIKNRIQRAIIYRLCKNANICVAAGKKSREYYLNMGIESTKIYVAVDSSTSPKGKKYEDIKQKFNMETESKVILYLGRIVERKGCHILIQALDRILKENKAYLLIAGDGDQKQQCIDLTKRMSEEDRIIFCGKIQPDERKNYYLQSDLFVLPSFSLGGVCEAWGLTVNEALECGTPVIATTAVGSAYDLIDDKNGFLVQENNIDELKKAISMFFMNYDLYDRKEIMERYDRFSVDAMAKEFSKAIEAAVSKNRR